MIQTNHLRETKTVPTGISMTAALAGVAAACVAPSAGATIQSATGLGISVSDANPYDDIGGMAGVSAGNQFYKISFPYYGSLASLSSSTGQVTGTLANGVDVIGPSTTFTGNSAAVGSYSTQTDSKGNLSYTGNQGQGSGIYGVSFNGGAGVRYGWVDVSLVDHGAGSPFGLTINGYGWDDTGASIVAGQTVAAAVPEPDALAMMALGGLGVAAAARRRKHKAAGARSAH